MRTSKLYLILSIAVAATMVAVPAAFAFDEPHAVPELIDDSPHGGAYDCPDCHRSDVLGPSEDCLTCHEGTMFGTPSPEEGKGPHGLYTLGSDRCSACHSVHKADGVMLLPKQTVTDTCFACHDGTGGRGVYGAIAARGLPVAARHRIDTTSTVPGGDASTGGSATMAFSGAGGTLGCDDCHSPHDASTVASFTVERKRTSFDRLATLGIKTNRLLRTNPAGVSATTTVYGSDWCLACHKGRSSAGPAHNHPVDSKATTNSPFYYEQVALLASDAPTSVTTTGSMAATNRGYLMPYPRTAKQAGHLPICQQCHEDARNVGALSADGLSADAATFSVTATDGLSASDNPRFQNFPHESANTRLLVEPADDLCTNCHPPLALP